MRFIIVFLCSLCITATLCAQKNFLSGEIVLDNGQTMSGWIDYRNWEKNPEFILYKKDSLSQETKRFDKRDLKSFTITGRDSYERAIVVKDMRSIKEGALENDTTSINVTDTAFLRVLIKSDNISLYELVDVKSHYFVRNKDGNLYELLYKLYLSRGGGHISRYEIYKDQLKALITAKTEAEKLIKRIDKAAYKADELSGIVAGINGEQVSTVYVAASHRKVKPRLVLGAGIGYSSIKFSDNKFSNVDFSGGVYPAILVGIDLLSARRRQSNICRFELSLRKTKYSGKGYNIYSSVFREDITYNISQQQSHLQLPSFTTLQKEINATFMEA